MTHRTTIVALLAAAAALAACAQEAEVTYAPVRQHGIVNGVVEEGFLSTVALGTELGGPSAMCTGNLLTPRVLISAAHCGDGIPITLVQSMGVAFFGTDVDSATAAIGFDDLIIHPEYVPLDSASGELGQYDLSIFVLKEDAPAEVEPTWFNRVAIGDEVIEAAVKSVGFGITGPDNNDSGTKRSADLLIADYDENFLISKNFYNPNNANICSGDSGGPQFQDQGGFWVQLAVHSWGDQNCVMESGSTRVDIAAEWILDQIEAVHGSRDVCAINGWYGDGVCHPFCDLPDEDCEVLDGDAGVDGGDDGDGGAPAADAGLGAVDPGGCGCAVVSGATPGAGSLLLLALIGAFAILRRRSRP